MKNISLIISIVLLSFAPSLIFSQTVVLINGVPTQVVLEGSEIVEIKGEVSNYLAGYEQPTSANAFQYSADKNIEQAAAVAESAPRKEKIISKTRTSDSPIVTGNYFKFEPQSALLSDLSINEIKDHASKVKAGKASTVLLESFHIANNKVSIELVQNRLEACKKYFEINGVPSNTIITNMYPNNTESNKVSVTLR